MTPYLDTQREILRELGLSTTVLNTTKKPQAD
jgi:hypothetical protein